MTIRKELYGIVAALVIGCSGCAMPIEGHCCTYCSESLKPCGDICIPSTLTCDYECSDGSSGCACTSSGATPGCVWPND